MRSPTWFGGLTLLGLSVGFGLAVSSHSAPGDCEEVFLTPRWLNEVRAQREVWEKTFGTQRPTVEPTADIQAEATQPHTDLPLPQQKPAPQEVTQERTDSRQDAAQQHQEWLRQWHDNPRRFSPYSTPPWLSLGQWGEDLNHPSWNSPPITPPPPPREWNNMWFFRGF
ncbi:hypothetical protein CCP4SC76_1850004 [Gammaproteobacteria bacterium]